MSREEDLAAATWAERIRAAQYEDAVQETAAPSLDALRSRRRREVRPRTDDVVRFGKTRLAVLGTEYPERPGMDYRRPKTRAECVDGERPCPFVSCHHHLYLDVSGTGSVKLNMPDLEVWEMSETCSLDVAERGGESNSGKGSGVTLEDVGAALNLTRERVRQIEARALVKIERRGHALAEFAEGFVRRRRRLPENNELADDDEDDDEGDDETSQ